MFSGPRLSRHPATARPESDPDEKTARRSVKHAGEEPASETGQPPRRGRARNREGERVPHPGREVSKSKAALRAALELDGGSLQLGPDAIQMTFARGLMSTFG